MLSPVDYQEFSWKYINQIIEALADHAPVIVLEKDVGLPLMKWAKVVLCVRVDGLAHQEMIFVRWKYHFTR
jgi:uroporphyrinogen-III decarboxylase